jgi:hypothetical protein
MRAALEKVKSELGREYPLVIGGERITTGHTLDSINQLIAHRSSDDSTRPRKSSPVALSRKPRKHLRLGSSRRPPTAPLCCFARPRSCANVNTNCQRG